MKRFPILLLVILLFLGTAWPRPAPLDGRWLFELLADNGSRSPLWILDVHGGTRPQARFLSVTGNVPVSIVDLQVKETHIHLDFSAQGEKMILDGNLDQDTIRGVLKAPNGSSQIIARRTQLASLPTPRQPSDEEMKAYMSAHASHSARKRITALQEFATHYPDSKLIDDVRLEIFQALISTKAGDDRLRQAARLAVESSPDRSTAMNNVAFALADAGRLLDLAEKYGREAVKSPQGNAEVRANFLDTLGWVLFKKGESEQSAQLLRKALKMAPRLENAAMHLGEVEEKLGDTEQAQQALLQAYISSGNLRARKRFQELYLKRNGSLKGMHALIDKAYLKLPFPFPPGRFKGKPTGRVILAEFFTGSECGPCQAVDLAFDGLLKHYPPDVLAVLEYHLHIPQPDPMTNTDSIARARYYGIHSTPNAIIDGTSRKSGGGPPEYSASVFNDLKHRIERELNQKPPVALSGKSWLEGEILHTRLKARFSDPEADPVTALRLRVVLVQSVVHYTGRNGVHFHRQVVRQLINGPQGTALSGTGSGSEQTFSSDLAKLEKSLERDSLALESKDKFQFSSSTDRLDRSKLEVVAFVQNDKTKRILNALVMPVAVTAKPAGTDDPPPLSKQVHW